jgi:hypothetical protein
MLKHCAANIKRLLSASPNVGPNIYTTLKCLALQGAPYIYDISRLRVNQLAFLMKVRRALCDVGTESLTVMWVNFNFYRVQERTYDVLP